MAQRSRVFRSDRKGYSAAVLLRLKRPFEVASARLKVGSAQSGYLLEMLEESVEMASMRTHECKHRHHYPTPNLRMAHKD
jgi:hypothetical protein